MVIKIINSLNKTDHASNQSNTLNQNPHINLRINFTTIHFYICIFKLISVLKGTVYLLLS